MALSKVVLVVVELLMVDSEEEWMVEEVLEVVVDSMVHLEGKEGVSRWNITMSF